MKNIFLYLAVSICLITQVVQAQIPNLKVGTNPTKLENSAAFEVQSNTKGFLPPRMTLTQIFAIQQPSVGLTVYCTDCAPKSLLFFDGIDWVKANGTLPITTLTILTQIGNEGDNPNTVVSIVTVAQINSISPAISGAIVANEAAYQAYIDANPDFFSSPATVSEVQAMINAVNNGTVSAITCNAVTNSGTITLNSAASGVSFIVPYTGGNGGAYVSNTFSSTGVTGLTASLSAGFFVNGSGSISFNVTGTPSSDGIASFIISFGGKTCAVNVNVEQPTFTITSPTTYSYALGQNFTYLLPSAYDVDYLPYTAPTTAASTTVLAADGTNEAVTLDVQGTISTSGITIGIPVRVSSSTTIPSFSQTITIPSNLTSDGISRNITLSWSSQSVTTDTKLIPATINAEGGTLNVLKLDVNSGLGSDGLGVLLGTFSFPMDPSGVNTSLYLRIVTAIPDKMFNVPDNNFNTTTSHRMFYFPVFGEDGKIYLNNNLGADYANISKSTFNPSKQATSLTDYSAYGSLFQWGRKPDGHEIVNWTSSTGGTLTSTTTIRNVDNPSHANFIRGSTTTNDNDWRPTDDVALWSNETSTNNPCPKGFRLPSKTEISNLATSVGFTNPNTVFNSVLKLSLAGYRYFSDGTFNSFYLDRPGGCGEYWLGSTAPTTSGRNAERIGFYGAYFSMNALNRRSEARSVRCIKN